PFSAPLSVAASGPVTQRTMPAPFKISARLPSFAPAASKSASEMEAPSPAPLSIVTSAPSATNFFTVSGMAAQRVSPAPSFRTAIFIRLFQDQKDDETDDQADDCAPFEHRGEARVVRNVMRHFLRRRVSQDRLFIGHLQTSPLSRPVLGCP